MKRQVFATAALALVLLSGSAMARENWRLIGSVTFDDPWQRSVVVIPQGVGPLDALRFDVKGADLEVGNVTVTYGNGQSVDVPVRSIFKGNSTSRAIPLGGQPRQVKQVTVLYRAHGPTRFNVMGDIADAPPPPPPPAWADLGCKSVGFLVDRDIIPVGRRDGAYRAIKLSVSGTAVEFLNVNVVYGNGQRDQLPVRQVIPPGGQTRAIDLAGKQRGIDRIELFYRAIPTIKTKAKVCAAGLLGN
ncbi:hypothetical protein [Aestuariivirga sp.]|uniref:hypothetical protein n=1 Tax=Aestuariivirga sp. TaxID=2650926 RepID=UPI0039E6D377